MQEDSTELGVSTGWQALDGLYKVVPGELTIVTGKGHSLFFLHPGHRIATLLSS